VVVTYQEGAIDWKAFDEDVIELLRRRQVKGVARRRKVTDFYVGDNRLQVACEDYCMNPGLHPERSSGGGKRGANLRPDNLPQQDDHRGAVGPCSQSLRWTPIGELIWMSGGGGRT
jgi:hypothetical protein